MITLYHCKDARSFRALWMLEECGLDYELKQLPFPPRFLEKSYLQENPLGTIPLLIDGETRMTESAAICEYLAARYSPSDLHVAPGDPAYGAYLNALHYGEATLTFPQTLVLRYSVLEPEEKRQPEVAAAYSKWFMKRLEEGLGRWLETSDYVAADRFTAADVSVGYALLLADNLKIVPPFPRTTEDYWKRLKARPAFQRAKAAQNSAS